MYKLYLAIALLSLSLPCAPLNAQTISFTTPDTVCVGSPVTITNQSTGSSYFWQFCAASASPTAVVRSLGNPSSALNQPVFTVPVKDGSNYYVFCVNHLNFGSQPGNLLRLDYGSSLLNTPAVTNLGSMGVIPQQSEQLEIKKDGNNWYGILVGGGQMTTPRIVTINFGTSLANNAPTAINHGNIGNLSYPIGLHVFQEGNGWYAYIANRLSSSMTRLSFGSTLANIPTGVNLSNIGGLSYPTTCRFIKEGNLWYGYVSNFGNNTITRLDFGTSLINTPTGTNLGNPGNALNQPTDMILFRTCNELSGYITNNGGSNFLKINFSNASATGSISTTALGNPGNFSFPHSISDPVRIGDTLYSFIPNVNNNTIALMALPSCIQPGVPSSTQTTPPVYSYSMPGTYTVKLAMDEGLPTQAAMCKEIVVMPGLAASFHLPDTAVCSGSNYTMHAPAGYTQYLWSNGSTNALATLQDTGKLWVRVSGTCGGYYTDTFAVHALPAPENFNFPDAGSCLTRPYTAIAPSGSYTNLWSDGSTSPQFSVSLPGIYWLRITNVCGQSFTDTFRLTASPTVTPGININTMPPTLLCAGIPITFVTNSIAGGNSPTYQWYKNGTAIAGATASTYTDAALADTDTLSVALYSSEACPVIQPTISNKVGVKVSPVLIPQVQITSNPSGALTPGQPVIFNATSVNGGSQAVYTWIVNGRAVPGNSAVFTPNNLRNGDVVLVRMESSAPCPQPPIVYSNSIVLHYTTGIINIGSSSVSVYPNPVADELFLDFSEVPREASLYLFDGAGRTVIRMQQLSSKHQQIDMRHLAAGIYTFNLVVEEGQVYRGKIVKQ